MRGVRPVATAVSPILCSTREATAHRIPLDGRDFLPVVAGARVRAEPECGGRGSKARGASSAARRGGSAARPSGSATGRGGRRSDACGSAASPGESLTREGGSVVQEDRERGTGARQCDAFRRECPRRDRERDRSRVGVNAVTPGAGSRKSFSPSARSWACQRSRPTDEAQLGRCRSR